MTHNTELIERVESTLATARNGMPNLPNLRVLLQDVRQRLEAHPFGVRQHLRDGGMVIDGNDRVYQFLADEIVQLQTTSIKVNRDSTPWYFVEAMMLGTIEPYHEPPTEHSKAWAIDQARSGLFVRAVVWPKYNRTNNVNTVQAAGEIEWELWNGTQETREPGWYSVQISGSIVGRFPEYWDGNHWDADGEIVGDDFFHWIGKTRIELETPEDEIDLSEKIGGTD